MRYCFVVIAGLISAAAFAAVERQAIPRAPLKKFVTDGLYEGGTDVKANLEGLRLAAHEDYERWVIDFSDSRKRTLDKVAPRFQLRYIPGDQATGPDGLPVFSKPAKFIFVFRAIQNNYLTHDKLARLVKKSNWVQEIVVYPPIEKGDTAVEFVLKDNVAFSPYQPVEREGRLVLDLKPIP